MTPPAPGSGALVPPPQKGKVMQTATATVIATGPDPDPDFDLDVSIVESGPVISDLLRSTDNGCNSTCATACTSCRS